MYEIKPHCMYNYWFQTSTALFDEQAVHGRGRGQCRDAFVSSREHLSGLEDKPHLFLFVAKL